MMAEKRILRLFCLFIIGVTYLISGDVFTSENPGTLIVLNKSEASASLIDLSTGKVVATVPTGEGPHEVAVSPDGKTAVVSNYGTRRAPGSTLTVIDVARARAIKTLELKAANGRSATTYQRPHGLAFLPDGERILVTAEAQQALLLVNVNTGAVLQEFKTNQNVSHMVVYAADLERAFVANIGSGSVTVVDVGKNRVLTTVATGKGAEGIALSPDGREVWIGNRADDSITILDARHLTKLATVTSKSFPIRLKFTPDGQYVLVSNARSGEVAVFDAATRKEIRRIAMKRQVKPDQENRLFRDVFGASPVPIGILVHPGGDRAYVANSNADVIAVLDLRRWQVVGHLKAGREPDGLGFSLVTPASPGNNP